MKDTTFFCPLIPAFLGRRSGLENSNTNTVNAGVGAIESENAQIAPA